MDSARFGEVARRLQQARATPPTVWSILSKWPGTPSLFVMGAVGASVYFAANLLFGLALQPYWLAVIASFVLGAFVRDLGIAFRATRVWSAQSYFIDWKKVDELYGRL